jgi:hypothetical protein
VRRVLGSGGAAAMTTTTGADLAERAVPETAERQTTDV